MEIVVHARVAAQRQAVAGLEQPPEGPLPQLVPDVGVVVVIGEVGRLATRHKNGTATAEVRSGENMPQAPGHQWLTMFWHQPVTRALEEQLYEEFKNPSTGARPLVATVRRHAVRSARRASRARSVNPVVKTESFAALQSQEAPTLR